MITKEELGALIKENMDANAFDIFIQDCCEIIKEKLEYKNNI